MSDSDIRALREEIERLQRRVDEFTRLSDPVFVEACEAAEFELVAPSELADFHGTVRAYAA